ncbi:EF-hand domain-containing protein [Sulfurovum sp. XGS-02]|uniref:EF-hand domain-containing protein n=1 Tax=Sulfurovum sp. XGS-02 TaxID=2925411 RepID=UPI002053114B|nr:EF-hand domain-containing protein [Sulfurovum sp. XGS-02]UPT78538.1 EF-hand domain-containing protein [Sulfurovum sp. XGS-02]
MKNILMIGLLASAAWAADFSHMSTEEMMKMRGSVPVDDRPAFREEMQKRMQSMTPEERQQYMQTKKGMGMGMGKMGKGNYCTRMQPTFEEYDLNSDGKITQSELEEARSKRMGQKAKEGKMLRNAGNAPAFADMDKNKDGSLNQEEFRLHQMEQMKKCVGKCPSTGMGQGKGMMRNASSFAEIDTNNDGVISQEEFRVHQTERMKNKGNCPSGNCP